MSSKKRTFEVRKRAFAIWQKLGYFPWRKEGKRRGRSASGDFVRGAFSDIPFLNDDAKRTFGHLLLRPGYMIRDYISGQHERYLAPLTALIIFYAFFALVSSLLQPIQQAPKDPFADSVTVTNTPIGAVTLAIVERDEPKCIKFELQNAPIQGNLWVQILPTSDYTSKMKCTIGIEANFFIRKMIEKHLKEGVEKLADMLAQIPYY